MNTFTASLFLVFLYTGIVSCQSNADKSASLPDILNKGRWVDLSYEFSKETIYWPNNPTGFQLDTQFNGPTAGGYFYASNSYCSPEHGGTHLDAPIHFARGKWTTDEIPLRQLVGEAVVVDVSEKAKDNADYQVSVNDIAAWEKMNEKIPDSVFLLIRTGWGKFYPDAAKYIGTAEKCDAAIAKLHFPGLHPDLASWLVKNRKVKAVGIDTPSIDFGQSKDFKSHQVLYAENILGFENLANLEVLPVKGSYIIALPMKIKGGSGGPLRIIAWIESV